ncbi:phage tail protein [Pseudomonas aeruginosa]
MNKPDSLKAHLLAAVPELRNNGDRLVIFIDNGRVRSTSAESLSFEYAYELQVILTDFAGHPDSVFLPLLGWLLVNQSDLLANLTKVQDGITFEADMLDRSKVDLGIVLPLTERVVVKRREDGRYDVSHPEEPLLTEAIEIDGPMQMFANGELLAEWTPPKPTEAVMLETPQIRRPANG